MYSCVTPTVCGDGILTRDQDRYSQLPLNINVSGPGAVIVCFAKILAITINIVRMSIDSILISNTNCEQCGVS